MNGFIASYASLSSTWKNILKSVITGAIAYSTILFGSKIDDIFGTQQSSIILYNAVIIIVMIAVLTFILSILQELETKTDHKEQTKINSLSNAHIKMDHWIINSTERLRSNNRSIIDNLDPYPSIKILLQLFYQILESFYSNSNSISSLIQFEVTFMTKSYRDGELTILAWSNRNGRKPVSMLDRVHNPKTYENTIAAQLYKTDRPDTTIIEDTSDKKYYYVELYDYQKDKIRSTIVYPVRCNNNTLIGVLVATCDETSFFKISERRYWREIFEIFSKRIAYEKVKMDIHVPFQDVEANILT